jgi:hypothetical protein
MDASKSTRDEQDATAYEPPTVTDYGRLTDITAGQAAGAFLDANFPSNTPKGQLTFSS